MKRQSITIVIGILLFFQLAGRAAQQTGGDSPPPSPVEWQNLAQGLEFGIFQSSQRSESGDSLIRVLRIDPEFFAFKLLNASASQNGTNLTVKQWCRRNNLIAGINASMYQTDYRTSVSLMRTRSHVNNPRLSKDKTILAFDRLRPDVPLVKIIDRQCEDFSVWKKRYGTFVQSIRMISCKGENVWNQQPKKWSTTAIGMDRQGKILFIHVGSPYSMHDLVNILQQLPIDISRAMYCEGGPQAQLYIRHHTVEYEFAGGFEINANETMHSPVSWPIPNVVGVYSRE